MRTSAGAVTDNISGLCLTVGNALSCIGQLTCRSPANGITKLRINQAGKTGAVRSRLQGLPAMDIAIS